ncbi:MAG: glycosyltransferase [Candidatus Absconditabacteria bacterium]
MLGLLYFGRLDEEKGVDGIIDMIEKFGKEDKKLPFELFIFGTGKYEAKLLELAAQYKEIHMFGWKTIEEIKRYVINCQYCLVPSTFLETFGLTALNALTWGLPVIGYKKGGLIPFVEEALDLSKQKGHSVGDQLFHIMKGILAGKIYSQSTKSKEERQKQYSIDARKSKVRLILDDKKKILLVSDFTSKVGGIETYIHDVKSILESMGYEVRIFGTTLSRGQAGKRKKLAGIAWGVYNFVDAFRLWRLCSQRKPDVIWYNSVLRWLGWMSIWATKHSGAERWMMYHDFGYVYPFPSELKDTQKVITPLTWKHFWKMVDTKNPVKIILLTIKYISLVGIKKQMKSVDLHLVPSLFMEGIVKDSYHLPAGKMKTLDHFLQG